MKLSQLGPPLIVRRFSIKPRDESDRWYICRICDQRVDRRDVRQFIWHNQLEHLPLEIDE
ncbi:hypothetical protein BFX40_23625 [Mesorhizobium sp. SEMIA 3007]|nr:hypothetical protein BFX40_23625 [Mesorhizobium sp. SEMIA 3007]